MFYSLEVGEGRLYGLLSRCCEQLMLRVVGWSLVGDDSYCSVVIRVSN